MSTSHAVDGGPELFNVHSPQACKGRACVMHSPSDHHMRAWPLTWRDDMGKMERQCPHGIGHPDPDDMAYHQSQGRDWMNTHACDGCCHPTVGDAPAKLRLVFDGDEYKEFYYGNTYLGYASHDEHGRAGMDTVEATVRAFAEALGVEIVES